MLKNKLIFIYPKLYTFVKADMKLLSDEFDLITIDQNWSNKFLLPFTFIQQFIFLLFNITKVDSILVSFGGYLSFLPALFGKLFRKKIAIVVHGTDCVSFPAINYGNLRKPLLRFFTKKSYQWASVILPVSESLAYTKNNYYSAKTLEFGFSVHLKNVETPYRIIPNGLDIEFWKKVKGIKKDSKRFVTVFGNEQVITKGVDLIIDIAQQFPEHTFYFAGVDSLSNFDISSNIQLLGRLTPEELRDLYSESRYYLQLSNTEGFGVALCEAMLCECIPIVSDVNYLPSIVDDAGFVLKRRNAEMLIDLINEVLKLDVTSFEQKARKRITDNFSSKNRQELLIKELLFQK
jgi:glycosyltransferase involved in cell wall biosynthesis